MSLRMTDCLASTEELSRIFSAESVTQAMLDFEVSLAHVEERLGVIPQGSAETIARAASAALFDLGQLLREAQRAGTPAIPLVRMLTERSGCGFVHWGATSQDVCDTAMVLLLRRAVLPYFAALHERLLHGLRTLSDNHAGTVMLGRTLLQPAPPVTFGLKCAGWFASLSRGWVRLLAAADEALVLQFGGASGTLASLGEEAGREVGTGLAAALQLPLPDAPWHSHRDRLASLLSAFAIYTGSLAKMAVDIALLMQHEVGEAAEPGGDGRGGSSAMPHKRNPTACMLAIAAAKQSPGLLANVLAAMPQEHERAAGGWQSEWPAITGIIEAAGVALESMVEVAEGLQVDAQQMRENLKSTRGMVFAEKAMLSLGATDGKAEARKKVEQILRETGALPEEFTQPEEYLGCAEFFRRRLLGKRPS